MQLTWKEDPDALDADPTGLQSLGDAENLINFISGIFYGTGLLEDTSDLELCKDILLTDFVAEA